MLISEKDVLRLAETCASGVVTSRNQIKNERKALKTSLSIIKGLLLNPLVLMVFVGIVFHFILSGLVW